MKSLILSLSILIVACSTFKQPAKEYSLEAQRLLALSESVNQKVYGDLLVSDGTLQGLNLDRYGQQIAKYKSERASDFRESLKEVDHQEVYGFKETFLYCAYSKKHQIAFCDDAACGSVERSIPTDIEPEFAKLREGLPFKECPRKN